MRLQNIRKRISLVNWPRAFLNLKEVFRCAAEYKKFKHAWPSLKEGSPNGDKHPVLVLPAFALNDATTAPFRRALEEKGYKAYAWEGGFNFGIKTTTAEHLYQRLVEIYEENGHQKVSLIGHSLGGIYARVLAQEYPNMVRDVITVGTPFGIGFDPEELRRHSVTKKAIDPKYALDQPGMAERLLTPPPVPTTSIYSKSDGIGGWKACLNPITSHSENVEVHSSHTGMIWHPTTIDIILDRLAQPEGQWKPYKRQSADKAPANPNWTRKPTDVQFFPPVPPKPKKVDKDAAKPAAPNTPASPHAA